MANGKGHIDCLDCKLFKPSKTDPVNGACTLMNAELPKRGANNTVCVHFESSHSARKSQWPTNLQFARFGRELTSGVLYEYDSANYELISETVIKLGPSGSGRWIDA